MIITALAAIKRAHRPHCCHGMPSRMAQKVAKQAGYVASKIGAFATLKQPHPCMILEQLDVAHVAAERVKRKPRPSGSQLCQRV
jgi:hypothetical protein